MLYTPCINTKPNHTFYPQNQQDIILDIAGNLSQIGKWTLKGFHQQQTNIELYLKLTRKNVNALSDRSFGKKFQATFATFCQEYEKLENEYKAGIEDHRTWANDLNALATDLTRHSHLV